MEYSDINLFDSTQVSSDGNNQGIVRLSQLGDEKVAWKVSQGYDFVMDHEARVMQALAPLESCCPNFLYSKQILEIDRTKLPVEMYDTNTAIKVPTRLVFMDYISNLDGSPARDLGNDEVLANLTPQNCFSIVLQVLNALWFGQKHAQFTHYDLHTGNILLKEVPQVKQAALYVTDSSVSLVPVLGQIPVIFDYGYSYVSAHDHKPFFSTFEHAAIGYLPCSHHPWMDTRFLTNIANERYPSNPFTRVTNKWEGWVSMFPRRGFANYYDEGWETNVNLGVPISLSEWLSPTPENIDIDDNPEYMCLEMAADTLGALASFPFLKRQDPPEGRPQELFRNLVDIITSTITSYEDSDIVGVFYAIVRGYIQRQNLVPIMHKLKNEFSDPRCTKQISSNVAKNISKIFRELACYIENFFHEIHINRLAVWEDKSGYITPRYRSIESIINEATAHAPEGIGEILKELETIVVYDLTNKTTTTIDSPQFPETPAELTLLYREGDITERVFEAYRTI
jgi:hypothetical protein